MAETTTSEIKEEEELCKWG